MTTEMLNAMCRSLSSPDETREFAHGRLDLVRLGDTVIGKIILEPGWKWSTDVKPIVGTESCQQSHTLYAIRGRLITRMDDGNEFEMKAGDAAVIPPGHDAWVVGDESFEGVDFTGFKDYAQKQ